MKSKGIRVLILVLALAVAASALAVFRRDRNSAESDYFTAAVSRGPLAHTISATGVVQTILTVQVGSQVSGQVEELYADYNSVVTRGQLLARLDTRNLEAQVANARASVASAEARVRSAEGEIQIHVASLSSSHANLEAARTTRDSSTLQFERAAEMNARDLISTTDYENARTNAESAVARYGQAVASLQQVEAQIVAIESQIEQARAGLQQATAELDRARINLEYANIYSPVDGIVISRSVDVGQTIAASMQTPTLFAIAAGLGRMQVSANVDEADIGGISEDAEVTFSVDAYPNEVFHGRIAEIRLEPQTIQNVVTYSVILGIENPEMKLRPGMTANITLTVDRREHTLMVPNAALRYAPPGETTTPLTPIDSTSTPREPVGSGREDADPAGAPLAPGQRWNPADKVRFVGGTRGEQRAGQVWVLGAGGAPERRPVVVGLTDGVSTEIVSGDLDETDQVIVGDITQIDAASQAQPGFMGGGGQ